MQLSSGGGPGPVRFFSSLANLRFRFLFEERVPKRSLGGEWMGWCVWRGDSQAKGNLAFGYCLLELHATISCQTVTINMDRQPPLLAAPPAAPAALPAPAPPRSLPTHSRSAAGQADRDRKQRAAKLRIKEEKQKARAARRAADEAKAKALLHHVRKQVERAERLGIQRGVQAAIASSKQQRKAKKHGVQKRRSVAQRAWRVAHGQGRRHG